MTSEQKPGAAVVVVVKAAVVVADDMVVVVVAGTVVVDTLAGIVVEFGLSSISEVVVLEVTSIIPAPPPVATEVPSGVEQLGLLPSW
jgi:hypothetical protein